MDLGEWAKTIVGGLIGGGLIAALKWHGDIKDKRRLAFVNFYTLATSFVQARWLISNDVKAYHLTSGDAMTAFNSARVSLSLLHPDRELYRAACSVHEKVCDVWALPSELGEPPYDDTVIANRVEPALDALRGALHGLLMVGQRLYSSEKIWSPGSSF